MEEICARLSFSRPVYVMHRPYETIVEETNDLIAAHSNLVFLIENCFDLSSRRLESLLRVFNGSQALLILTSRSISARAGVSDFQRLSRSNPFGIFACPALTIGKPRNLSGCRTRSLAGLSFRGPMRKSFVSLVSGVEETFRHFSLSSYDPSSLGADTRRNTEKRSSSALQRK
jgi:hypothetical protein